MAERGDITVNQDIDVVMVAAPSEELKIQDLHDTMRAYEDDLVNTIHDDMIASSGKQDLGGVLKVGVTSELQDGRRVAFEGRKGWTCSGTITTPDAGGTLLVDSSATFITDGVEPGAWGVNFPDGSDCSVMVVVSETTLITDGLGGGTDNEFGVGDSYKIKNVTLCQIKDGNLTAKDRQGNSIIPMLPTVGVMVMLSSSSSATLIESTLGPLTPEQEQQLIAIFRLGGLDHLLPPLKVSPTQRTVGTEIVQKIDYDEATDTTTITRVP